MCYRTEPTPRLGFYHEPNGDFLVVDQPGYSGWEGRAAAVEGIPGSVTSTGMSEEFLAACVQVPVSAVPADWLRYLVGSR